MNSTAHGAYAFAIYLTLYQILWHAWSSSLLCFFAIAAGMAPDLDALYYIVVNKQSINEQRSQHHLYSWSHWPSSYLPLAFAFALSLVFNFYPAYFLIALVGPFSHCLFDSIACGDGMMWGMSFWRKRRGEFARFTNLDARTTDGYHGTYYFARYRQTKYFILENIAAVGTIVFLGWQIWTIGFEFWFGGALLEMIGTIGLGLRRVDSKFADEPPQGRYADYHTDPAYVAWFQAKYRDLPPKKYGENQTI